MDGRHEVRVELSYDEGLQVRVLVSDPMVERLRPSVEEAMKGVARPALEVLPGLVSALETAGAVVTLSEDAHNIQGLWTALHTQQAQEKAWLDGNEGAQLGLLRKSLTPYQLSGAAFLAHRAKAILADDPALDPIGTVTAAAAIARARGARQVVVLAPEGRLPHWREAMKRLLGKEPMVAEGSRAQRSAIYDKAPLLLLVGHGDLIKDRSHLEKLAPQLLVIDQAFRLTRLSNKALGVLRKLSVPQIIALAPIDPLEHPEGLHGLMSILVPVIAGDRSTWESRYVDRRDKSNIKTVRLSELRARIQPFYLRRTPQNLGAPPSTIQEVRLVPLGKAQRAQYHRVQKSLRTFLDKEELRLAEKRKAEISLATLREVCLFTGLRSGTVASSKLEELSSILQEDVLPSHQKAIIFTQWEAASRQISEKLKQLNISHVRHYRKLPTQRREGLLMRFMEEPSVRVLLATDSTFKGAALEADLVVHFDAPWKPAVVAWRRAQVVDGGREELALLAADTLEEVLWARAAAVAPDGKLFVEEEEVGVASVSLFSAAGATDMALTRQFVGLDPTPPAVVPIFLKSPAIEIPKANPTDNESAVIDEDGRWPIPVQLVLIPKEEPSPVEEAVAGLEETSADRMETEAPTVDSVSVEQEVAADLPSSPVSSTKRAEEGPDAGPESQTKTTEPATPKRAEEGPKAGPKAQPKSSEPAMPLGQSGADVGRDQGASASGDVSMHVIEIPLKAINRILAGIPVVGEPVSRINGALWELLAGRFLR